jgi:hypothetical protein
MRGLWVRDLAQEALCELSFGTIRAAKNATRA